MSTKEEIERLLESRLEQIVILHTLLAEEGPGLLDRLVSAQATIYAKMVTALEKRGFARDEAITLASNGKPLIQIHQ